ETGNKRIALGNQIEYNSVQEPGKQKIDIAEIRGDTFVNELDPQKQLLFSTIAKGVRWTKDTGEVVEMMGDVILYSHTDLMEMQANYVLLDRTTNIAKAYHKKDKDPKLTFIEDGLVAEANYMEYYIDLGKGEARGDV